MTENEVPWSRGRRETQRDKADDTYCVLIQPDERTTGKNGHNMFPMAFAESDKSISCSHSHFLESEQSLGPSDTHR